MPSSVSKSLIISRQVLTRKYAQSLPRKAYDEHGIYISTNEYVERKFVILTGIKYVENTSFCPGI